MKYFSILEQIEDLTARLQGPQGPPGAGFPGAPGELGPAGPTGKVCSKWVINSSV